MATTDPLQKARTVLSQAHSVYDLPSTEQAIKWMHAVCGYPVKSTWLKAVQAGNFIGWPLLTAKNVQKYYPDSAKHPRDTSTRHARTSALPNPNRHPSRKSTPTNSGAQSPRHLHHYLPSARHHIHRPNRPIPVRSQAGNKYIMVMVEIDSSAILVEPIKNRTGAELTRAYSALMLRLRRAGIVPRKHVLDNEISAAMKDLIQDTYKMSLELVPPGCHRRRAAEVAIRNFKSHFLSVLAGVADDFPLKLWDKLLPQAEITLNLLRQSNATPTVSAYAHLNGPFDYNKMPLAPMGCNAQVHEKTDSRGTWAFHSVDGWCQQPTPAPRAAPTNIHPDKLGRPTATTTHSAAPTSKGGTTSRATTSKGARSQHARHTLHDNSSPGRASHAHPTCTTSQPPSTTPLCPPISPPLRRHTSPNTRSQTAAVAKLAVPPALNTRSRTSRIPPPTPITRHQTSRLTRMENEVHKALAVLDKSTGVGGRIKGTDTIRFIRQVRHSPGPPKRRHIWTVRLHRPPRKSGAQSHPLHGRRRPHQLPGEVATPTAEMLTAKLLFNSVISTPGAKFMTMDISNFYLMTPLPRPEYLRLKLSDIPTEIIREYRLDLLAGRMGPSMSSCNSACKVSHRQGYLPMNLNAHGYHQSKLVPGLWKHIWRPIQFTLVVDDFGIKYVGDEHPQHLLKVLQEHYTVTTDWKGSRYIGITLDWDYGKRRVHLSMPGYVKKALSQFQHPTPQTPQHAPFPATPINYGARQQYAKAPSTATPLDPKGKKFIQQVCGKFLFLGRAVDPTLLCPISAIASQSSKPTVETLKQTKQLLDYIATQGEAVLTYNASDMVLAIHSDASYLSEPAARSRAGGHFFLSSNAEIPPNNGAVLNIAHIIKHVMASATEAELAALYIMAREAVFIRIILEELGHTQPATPLQTDNSTAEGVVNGKIQPKRTKAMDMRFHWLRDRKCQEQNSSHHNSS
eukprot:CCRYP_000903-RA/>CCRYP_000903-RA protein AED:0.16 eAED:0.16 QI:0/0/0/1/1/1/4/0/960